MFPLAIPVGLLIASLVGVYIARRGRRIDDHPLCRKCGFDLTGKPDDSSRCAECGADLTKADAIRIGHRAPYRRWLTIARATALLSLGGMAFLGYTQFRSATWQQQKPVWWLMWETRETDIATRDAALQELDRRLAVGQLSEATIVKLTAAGLSHQADQAQTWVPGWGKLIETAKSSGRLRQEDWVTYLQQSVAGSLELRARQYVRRGDVGYFEVYQKPARIGAATIRAELAVARPTAIGGVHYKPGGPDHEPDDVETSVPFQVTAGGTPQINYFLISEEDPIWAKLRNGLQNCDLDSRIDLFDSASKNALPVAKTQVRASTTIDLHPATDPAFRQRNDPALRATMQASIRVTEITASDDRYLVKLNTVSNPIPLMMAVSLRVNGKTINVTPTHELWETRLNGGSNLHRYGILREPGTPMPQRADLVLTPLKNERPGCGMINGEMWGEEIIIKDVPVLPESVK